MFDEILLAVFGMEVGDTLEYGTCKGILKISTYITDIQEIDFILYNLHMQEIEKSTCTFDDEEIEEQLYYILD